MTPPPLMDDGYGIGLYAPAGFVTSEAALERAVARLSALGHRVVVDETCRTRWQRFSATDDARLAAIGRMAGDPRVTLAMAARGGYGWSRLLDRIDFAALAATRKRWIGHSDFTAFQLAALAHAGMTTFARPDGRVRFRRGHALGVRARPLLGLARQRPVRDRVRARRSRFRGRGHAMGRQPRDGCASRRHAASAARRARHPFLEDIAEHPYRVERMLYQLHFAGILARQRAVLLGTFNGYELAPNDNGYDAAAMVAHFRATQGVPLYTGLPFGHVPEKLTLPVGGHCALTVRSGRAQLVFSRLRPAALSTRAARCDSETIFDLAGRASVRIEAAFDRSARRRRARSSGRSSSACRSPR